MSSPCRRPRPVATVSPIESNVITGNATYMGLRVTAEPERKTAAMTPIVATDTTTGSRRVSGPGDCGGGSAGGASMAMSVAATAGGGRRAAGANP
jgi:hypothetical protein